MIFDFTNVIIAFQFMPKVIINGPECSGKTTLCEYLVKKLDAGYIQEYPRIYLEMTEGKYDQEVTILAKQVMMNHNISIKKYKICILKLTTTNQ